MGRLEQLLEASKEIGKGSAILLALSRALNRIHGGSEIFRYLLVAQPVARSPLLPAHLSRKFETRLIAPENPALQRSGRDIAEIRARAAAGARCLAVFRDQEPIGFIWTLRGSYAEKTHPCILATDPGEQTALDIDVVVVPEARGTPAFAALWDAANEHLRAEGVAWSLSRISAFNPRSLRPHRRLGAEVIGGLTFIKLGSLVIMIGGPRPGVHVCSGDNRRLPRVILRVPPSVGAGDTREQEY